MVHRGDATDGQKNGGESRDSNSPYYSNKSTWMKPISHLTGKSDDNGDWIVDSGSTEHITHNIGILENRTQNRFETPVVIPNGDAIPVEGRGECTLPGGTKIKDVLHIPKFTCNLLSVSRLSNDLQSAITFFPDFCVMQKLHTRKLIGTGECRRGLYRMRLIDNRRKAMMTSGDTWHKRLGHASADKLAQIDLLGNFSCNKLCDSCSKAKHTRLPFQDSNTRTKDCFDLLHCDIWGKYRTPSFSGASYFLTIVDDFSRGVWVFLLKHKHEASQCLKFFCKMINTQFGKSVKRVRSDNGGEFTSNDMLKFYSEQGMMLETTCPHTPQQNGVVERKHRHLIETARALRFEANLPKRFWGECVLTAAYLINRLPSIVIENRTPYETIFGQKPDYHFTKIFGCLAYYRSTETKGDKFEPRGRPGVFLGYPPGIKGYKIYDIENKKIIVSRDVRFYENNFPFKGMNMDLKETTAMEHPLFVEEENPRETDLKQTTEVQENVTEVEVAQMPTNECPSQEDQIMESPHSEQAEPNTTQNSSNSPTSSIIEDVSPQDPIEEQSLQHNEPVREKRNKTQPKHFGDYFVQLPPSVDHAQSPPNQDSSTVHPLANFVSYKNFSESHKVFLAAIDSNDEPKYFHQAIKDDRWKEAMKKEIRALEENDTWVLEELPEGKRAIDSKWVYKVKHKPNGEVDKFKARLVAKGFTQMEGVDYHDTFAPVAKLVTVRTLLAVAVKRNWAIHQLDVNNAFLHGDLDEEVYMKIPQGFVKEGETRVCRLKKSLYGLKQASRNWYQKFTNSILDLGFKQSKADHSLFIQQRGKGFIAALIYVDDVIIVGNDTKEIQRTKDRLNELFSIKDLGNLKYFLGIEVARTAEGLVLNQRKYILDILNDCGLQGCRPSFFPIEQNTKLGKSETEPKVDASRYRRIVGRLIYLQATRPDVAYAVNMLSQFVSDPRKPHMDALHRVLRYLKTSPGKGILLPRNGGTNLTSYCDSDWLGCQTTRRSRTGYLLHLGGAPISWKTKKQSVVSRSSAEAEYRSMASTVSEVLWVRWLLQELNVPQTGPTPVFCDNQAARHIAINPVFHERTKHVEMDCYFVRERVDSKEIKPFAIDTKMQIADLFTKGLGTQQLQFLLDKLGTRDLHAPT